MYRSNDGAMFPVISLEVQGMKYAIKRALSEEAMKIDANVQAAVEKYCSEENINYIVQEEVKKALDTAVKE